ncbi:translation initiation factor IF-2 [Candidatus Uhrbacteria bacterium]|nr:translation initiation factor IF-2 [Candidatus Uhrbacteria bacterium]
MNVSELARRINLPPQELYELLPQFGFDIGRRAIKIDDQLAQRFLKQWPRIRREYQRRKEKERDEEERKQRRRAVAEGTAREVVLPAIINVRDFAALLHMPVSEVLQELLRNGILANMNEPIDYATAAIIAEDLGFRPSASATAPVAVEVEAAKPAADEHAAVTPPEAGWEFRAPVVVVLGHVDHGKTSLLDRIRSANVASGEAGGITQHIGAYQTMQQGKPITFIDTPGHEAFTTMRSRGARVADIGILVVAADDGVQPQTKEALKIIQAAKLPFIVAMNKVDKSDANTERVRQELGALGVLSEEWSGKTPFVPVSAKTGEGVEKLLEMVLLVADVERERLQADPRAPMEAATIESHLDKQEGPVATLLVQKGTLRSGDVLALGGGFAGKVRAMRNYRGELLDAAPPSTPVRILGFKVLPEVGDIVMVSENRHELTAVKRKVVRATSGMSTPIVVSSATTPESSAAPAIVLPLVVRADGLGSLEALCNEIEKIGGSVARVQIIGRGLGNINEADVAQAEAAKGQIFGFGVHALDPILRRAREAAVSITTEKIIYEILAKIRSTLETMLPEEILREDLGTVQILALFRKEPKWHVAGCKVLSGKIVLARGVQAKLVRGGEVIAEGRLLGLQSGKEEIREVVVGQECGMKIGGIEGMEVGDQIHFIREEKRKQKL